MPWTPGTLYDWLKATIGGINISSTGPDQCCSGGFDDGRSYFNVRAKDDYNRNWLRSWVGISEFIALMMHERRHADPGGYPHAGCCPAGPNSCDQEYNEGNLSPYGIQWWLRRQWIEGGLYTGYACLSAAEVNDIKNFLRNTANQQGGLRFCQNVPPILTDANNPVGGCDWWSCASLRWGRLFGLWLIVWVPIIFLTTLVGWLFYKRARAAAVARSTNK